MTDKIGFTNPEIKQIKKRLYAREYYQTHKKEARIHYKKNREKIKARSAKWKVENRERYLTQQNSYDLIRRNQNRGSTRK